MGQREHTHTPWGAEQRPPQPHAAPLTCPPSSSWFSSMPSNRSCSWTMGAQSWWRSGVSARWKKYVTTSASGLAGSNEAHRTRKNLDTDRVLTTRKPSRWRAQGPGTASVSASAYVDARRARSNLNTARYVPAARDQVKALACVLAAGTQRAVPRGAARRGGASSHQP